MKGIQVQQACDFSGGGAWAGKMKGYDILLVLTGMGKEKALQAARWAAARDSIELMISAGFGGALNKSTQTGDVVVYSRLRCGEMNGQALSPSATLNCDAGLVDLAMQNALNSGIRAIKGAGVTLDAVCSSAGQKAWNGQKYAADVVDMESYWTGKIAAEKNIPFLAVRSIFDSLEDDLSIMEKITLDGKIAPFKALGQVIRHPGYSKDMRRYYNNYRKAARNLTLFLNTVISGIEESVRSR
jgi:adenosylhomocysteine nucleosidase